MWLETIFTQWKGSARKYGNWISLSSFTLGEFSNWPQATLYWCLSTAFNGKRVADGTPSGSTWYRSDLQWETTPPPLEPRIYRVSFPRAARYVMCPVEVYKGGGMTRTNPQIYLVHSHMQDMVMILTADLLVTCLCYGRNSTAATPPPPSGNEAQNRKGGGWRRRSHRWVQQWSYDHTVCLWIHWHHANTWITSSQRRTMTDRKSFSTSRRRGRSGSDCQGS